MTGEGRIGVISLGVGLQSEAAQMVLVLKLPHRVRLLALELARDGHVPGATLPAFLQQLVVVKPQDAAQPPGDERRVLAVGLDLRGA